LRVADNQTIVLGGLMRDTTSETISKLPWLSAIPVLGKFFQEQADEPRTGRNRFSYHAARDLSRQHGD
jgi:type II secretory pathway component GspD/PulD (secretin)